MKFFILEQDSLPALIATDAAQDVYHGREDAATIAGSKDALDKAQFTLEASGLVKVVRGRANLIITRWQEN